jgi:hypothetical protein
MEQEKEHPMVRQVSIVDVKFGKRVTLVEPVNLYGCEIGDDSLLKSRRE